METMEQTKQQSFLENIYGAMFTPNKTFEELKQAPAIEQAFSIVVIVSVLGVLLYSEINNELMDLLWVGFNILTAAFSGVVSWIFFASFFELISGIFKKSGKVRVFLTLSGFALLPWIFLAPVELFKTAGTLGDLVGILLGLGVWLWSTSLMVLAVMKTYEVSFGRTLVFLVLPFVGGFLAFNWIIGFFSTLGHILSV